MRDVAVTEGDKVAAEAKFGYSVNGYGVGDLVSYVNEISDAAITKLCTEYEARYTVAKALRKGQPRHAALRDGARIELGMRAFLEAGNFKGFTTTFEDLHGLKQLPGLAVQRLMTDGYGFGGEGDWKTCTLLRAMKVIAADLKGGTSFMEDYTYHLHPKGHLVLGAHMLEICESIADKKPSLEIHPGHRRQRRPRSPGFQHPFGPAINASLIDLGNRFRLIINEVDVAPPQALPKPPRRPPYGNAAPISKPPAPPGSTPAAPTTPASARPLPPNTSKTLPTSWAWKSPSSTAPPHSAPSNKTSAPMNCITTSRRVWDGLIPDAVSQFQFPSGGIAP